MTAPVADRAFAVLDAREGFYMVRIAAIEALRTKLAGAPLASALGAAVMLARQCRRGGGSPESGEQCCELRIEELQGLLRLSRNPTRRVCENLSGAGAVRWESARYEGSLRKPGRFTFLGPEHPFAWVEAAACAAIMAHCESMPLRTLAIYLTFVEQAGRQRDQFPDAPRRMARMTFADLERLSGVSERSARDHIARLEAIELLAREAQPEHELKTATVWRLLDCVATTDGQVAEGEAKRDPRTGDKRERAPASADSRTGENEVLGQAIGDPRTSGAGSKDPRELGQGSANRDSRVRAIETLRETEDQTPSSVVASTNVAGVGDGRMDAERLCQLFLEEFLHLGSRPARHFERDRAAWLTAAGEVLDDFGWAACAAAIAYVPGDWVLVSSATTMPAFAKVAEKVVARAHAVARSGIQAASGTPEELSWAAAWSRLRRAASVHGTAAKNPAVSELAAEEPRFGAFIEQVRWRTICEAGPTGQAGWKQLWESLASKNPTDTEEAA